MQTVLTIQISAAGCLDLSGHNNIYKVIQIILLLNSSDMDSCSWNLVQLLFLCMYSEGMCAQLVDKNDSKSA
eukprot:c33493_g1_i1 orf=1-213(-)